MKDFWIINITNKVIIIGDLNLEIGPFKTLNLMDSKHFSYTYKMLEESKTNGSLYKKRNVIKIRTKPLEKKSNNILINYHTYDKENKVWSFDTKGIMPSRKKSIYEITQEKYEELNVSDEDFAETNAEIESNIDQEKA